MLFGRRLDRSGSHGDRRSEFQRGGEVSRQSAADSARAFAQTCRGERWPGGEGCGTGEAGEAREARGGEDGGTADKGRGEVPRVAAEPHVGPGTVGYGGECGSGERHTFERRGEVMSRTDVRAAEVYRGRERPDAAGAGGDEGGRKGAGRLLPLFAVHSEQFWHSDLQLLGRTDDGKACGAAERAGALLGLCGTASRAAGGAVLLCV